jgi:hypothetical protein
MTHIVQGTREDRSATPFCAFVAASDAFRGETSFSPPHWGLPPQQ